MNDIYAMQRANGDWFAVQAHERLRVPLFRSSHDAMMARLRNFGMLLFNPIAIDVQLLKEIVPAGGESYVDFCMVDNPFASLGSGNPIEHAALELLLTNPVDRLTESGNGKRL